MVLDEAVQLTTLLVETLEVATTPVGAGGVPAGMTSADADDSAEVPLAFVAVTLKVYATPFESDGTAQLVAPVVVQVLPVTTLPEA